MGLATILTWQSATPVGSRVAFFAVWVPRDLTSTPDPMATYCAFESVDPVIARQTTLEMAAISHRMSAELVVNFDGRIVTFVFGELDTLVPPYAATIHNSQGSEYPAVVIPV